APCGHHRRRPGRLPPPGSPNPMHGCAPTRPPQRRPFFFSSRRRHTSSVSAFLLNRSSDLLLLVWLIFFMVLIKLLPILGTISGKTVKLMVLALICLGNNRQD